MGNDLSIKNIETDSLSRYKTLHNFEHYGEITSLDDYNRYLEWAKENKKDIYILGNGSNTLFTKKKIKSLVLKNNIAKQIECINNEENLYEVSTSVRMNEILNYCYKRSLDSFYFLASVPATIGGALAMNAGEGKRTNRTIYDFVESVTYIDDDYKVKTIKRQDMDIQHRHTMFTGRQEKFIISAVFKFPKANFIDKNPIKERVLWSKEYQDNVAPNCGSVFKESDNRILRVLRGLTIGKAKYSSKATNWINNKSKSSKSILTLILIAKIIHYILRKVCKVELIRVK